MRFITRGVDCPRRGDMVCVRHVALALARRDLRSSLAHIRYLLQAQ